MTVARPRSWIVAGFGAAIAVALIFAISVAVFVPDFARYNFGIHSFDAQAGTASSRLGRSLDTFFVAGTAAGFVGLPIALIVTGVMSMAERSAPVARRLPAWLATGVVAGAPAVICLAMLNESLWSPALFGDLAGVVGAGIAWFIRHGRAGRITSASIVPAAEREPTP